MLTRRNPVRFQAAEQQAFQNQVAVPQPQMSPDDFSVWRHTPLRYAGYADEVGEFMTPYSGAFGKFLGYVVSGLYCVADMGTSLTQKYKNASPELTTGQKTRKTAAEGVDLSFFHLMASLLVPPKLIGAVVETASHILDDEALAHARQEAQKSGVTSSSGGLLNWFTAKKLEWETALNRQLAPHVERFLAAKQAERGPWIQKVESASDWLLNKRGPQVAPLVALTAEMAERYNRWMPVSYFKDEEIGRKLKENIDFLNNPQLRLSPRQITKLAWLKPLPVLLGIGMIPIVAHPFDKLMGKIQNWTTRPLVGKNKIVREEGQLKSVRNPEFWGKHPKNSRHPGKRPHLPPSTFSGHVLQAHYRRQVAARFGTMAYYPYLYRPRPVLTTPAAQPANPLIRPVYPAGHQGFYC
jgi:hypothetical protein